MANNLPKIYLSAPHLGTNERKYVAEAFDTNWVAPLGPNVNGFEQEISAYLGGGSVAALTSGTSALHLALIIAGVKPGDVVICQSFTFAASANPIQYVGAEPVFVDSERATWNMSPELTQKAIEEAMVAGKRVGAIIPVHLYGMPAQMDAINAIAQKYDIPVIEDAAEAFGSTFLGKYCGRLSPFGVLSFNGNKIITTSGGGALVCERSKDAEKARFLATQARDQAPHYQHSEIGFNYRMSNVVAGIGRGQLEVLDERVHARRAVFEMYVNYFTQIEKKGYHIEFQPEQEGSFSNRWLTAILIHPKYNKGKTREDLRLHLEKYNIESRPLWKPMHLQPVWSKAQSHLNGTSEHLFDIGLCLPSGSNLTNQEKQRIFTALDEFFIQ